MLSRTCSASVAIAILVLVSAPALAQGTAADYQRASLLRAKYESLAVDIAGPATWIEKTSRFWYRKSVKGGNEFVLVEAGTAQKRPPFDHARLAAVLSSAAGGKYTAVTLPFSTFSFTDNEQAIEFTAAASTWRCTLTDYTCRKTTDGRLGGRGAAGGGGRGGQAPDTRPRVSPDGKWEALINNFNVVVRPAGATKLTRLSLDGF